MLVKINDYKKGKIPKEKLLECFQGWNTYAKGVDSLRLRRDVVRKIYTFKTN